MPHGRYQLPNAAEPRDVPLPTDTVCTILVRQSTLVQAERNPLSSELHPDELVALARAFGFDDAHTRLVEDDMGIGAYSTTIEQRPGLKRFTFEDLPAGVSRVVLASNEDRLFRDRDEVEHNRFIRACTQYGGWAICGHTLADARVYNLRRPFDQDRFRWACRAGKEFIEGHLKLRLHPSIQRAAMRGQYTGGLVPLGYIVDYDLRSLSYRHLMSYAPHVPLLVEHVFTYFANLPQPSLAEVVRHWRQEGLVWPFYAEWVDPRVVHGADARRTRDEAGGGYLLTDWRYVRSLLTNVAYLGWVARKGEVATGSDGQPLVCHPPLVEAELFWWCFDRTGEPRPPWAPQPLRAEVRSLVPVVPVARAHRSSDERPGEVRFLARGRVRCAVHGRVFFTRKAALPREGMQGSWLACDGLDPYRPLSEPGGCPVVRSSQLEPALCEAFLEQLVLDERDLAELARMAEQRQRRDDGREARLRQELAEARARVQRALEAGLRQEHAEIREEFYAQALDAKRVVAEREAALAALASARPLSGQAWTQAHQAVGWAERIRSTFLEWSRAAQARVLNLALGDAVVGYVQRRVLGLWMRWHGGGESRREVRLIQGKRIFWTPQEEAAVRRYYPVLTWEALDAMFPLRTRSAIKGCALKLGVQRRGERGPFVEAVPLVFGEEQMAQTSVMASYGFPLQAAGAVGVVGTAGGAGAGDDAVRSSASRRAAPTTRPGGGAPARRGRKAAPSRPAAAREKTQRRRAAAPPAARG